MPSSSALTRASLVNVLIRKAGLSRQSASALLEATLESIGCTLCEEESVKITSFGSFKSRHKGRRVGRNPKTKKEALIPPRRIIKFTPSVALRNKVGKQPKIGPSSR